MNIEPQRQNQSPLLAVICTLLILLVSVLFTLWTLSTPERMKYFNYVMFIPAPFALAFYWFESKSIRLALSPIMVPNLHALSFSVIFPIVFLLSLTGILLIIDLGTYSPEKLSNVIQFLPKGSGLLFAFLLLFGEEYAWRGYLLPKFTKAWGPLLATCLVGAIWAIWHGPLVYGLVSQLGTTAHPLIFTCIQMAAVFTLSFPFAYSYYISKSIIPAVIIHFLWNWLNPVILGNVYRNQPGIIEGDLLYINGETIGGVLLGSLFVIWFILQVRKKKNFASP